jgi:hypothetical protein
MSDVYKCMNGLLPEYLRKFVVKNSDVHNYNTRAKNNIHISKINSKSCDYIVKFRINFATTFLEIMSYLVLPIYWNTLYLSGI